MPVKSNSSLTGITEHKLEYIGFKRQASNKFNFPWDFTSHHIVTKHASSLCIHLSPQNCNDTYPSCEASFLRAGFFTTGTSLVQTMEMQNVNAQALNKVLPGFPEGQCCALRHNCYDCSPHLSNERRNEMLLCLKGEKSIFPEHWIPFRIKNINTFQLDMQPSGKDV